MFSAAPAMETRSEHSLHGTHLNRPHVLAIPPAGPGVPASRRTLLDSLNESEACYRLVGAALERPKTRALLQAGAPGVFRCGDDYVDVRWPVSLAPLVLSPQVVADVSRLGAIVPDVLRTSWDYLRARQDARSFVFRSTKSEGHHFDHGGGYPVGDDPIYRLDLLLDRQLEHVRPWLVDINLMAGMAGITGVICDSYNAYVQEVWQTERPGAFDLDGWAAGIAGRMLPQRDPQPSQDSAPFAYLIRAGHALVPDAKAVLRALELRGVPAIMTHLDGVHRRGDEFVDGSGHRVTRVFRQARRVTKHSDSAGLREREDRAFEGLESAATDRLISLDPGFYMYMESHAWLHYWRDPEFSSAFQSSYGAEAYEFLLSHIPATARVIDETRIADHRFEVRHRRRDDLDGIVLKRADSTGGDGLVMTSFLASSTEVDDVVGAIGRSHTDGLLLQSRIPDDRFRLPIPTPAGHATYVSGRLKLAAYFRGRTYLGAHALLYPDAGQDLDAGSALNLLPLFVPVYGDTR